MKLQQKNLFFLMLFFSASLAIAKNNVYGIYKTEQDYIAGKISFSVNCKSSKNKIKLHHFFSKNYIDIIKNGAQTRLYKDSIFGYQDCEQNNYRFYKNNEKEFQILENDSIVIYSTYVSVPTSSGKRTQLIPAYFFSKTLEGNIFPLTVLNLKKVFPDNLKFHDSLDVFFGDGTPLSLYDEKDKMYKINFLLRQSQ